MREAHQEWVGARNFFDNVTDPALVDYAIYADAGSREAVHVLAEAGPGSRRRCLSIPGAPA